MPKHRLPILPFSLALAAAGGAVFLGLQPVGVGCGPVGGCGEVLSSKWASFHGVPVAFGGAALWGLLAVTSGAFARGSRNLAGWLGMLAVTGTLLGAGWFMGLQAVVLKAFCPICAALHGLAGTAAFMLLWRRRQGVNEGVSLTGGWLAGAAALSLMAATWGEDEKNAFASEIAEPAKRLLPLKGGTAVDFTGFPKIGRGDPAGVFLMDFTCTHCRKMLDVLRRMAAQDAAMPAVALMPAVLGEEGAKIHRTLLSLYLADAAAWESVVAALLDGKLEPRADLVAQAAMLALGPENFGAALQSGQAETRHQLEIAAAIYDANRTAPGGSAALPQLMNGEKLLTGLEADAARLAAFLGTSPLPPATNASPVLVTAALPEMRPAAPAQELPQWRPRPLPPEQQSPRPPANLVNAPH